MQLIDDKSLIAILQVLFKELKKGALQNRYYTFRPEDIEVLEKRKINFETIENAKDLRESLQELGKTAYKLVTGESYQAGQNSSQQQTEKASLWYFIMILLSGNVYSIPKVETLLNDIQKETLWQYTAWHSLCETSALVFKKILSAIKAIIVFFFFLPVRFVRLIDDKLDSINKILGTIFFLGCIAEIIWYWKFNWSFSSGPATFLFTVVFVIIIPMLYNFTFDWSDNVMRGTLAVMRRLFLPLISLWMLLFASLSFWAPIPGSPEKNGNTVVMDNAVIVERKTGNFVARLPLTEDDTAFIWESVFINHFKYKIVSGLPLSDMLFLTYTPSTSSKKFEITLYYDINKKDSYGYALQKFGTRQNVLDAIHAEFNKVILPSFMTHFSALSEEYSQSFDTSLTPTSLILSPDIVTQEKGKLEKLLRAKVDQDTREMPLQKYMKITVKNIVIK